MGIEIRIRQGIPCKGVSLPRAFVGADWVPVDEDTAAYARTFRLHPTNAQSPLVFEEREAPKAPAPTTDEKKDDAETAPSLGSEKTEEPPPAADPKPTNGKKPEKPAKLEAPKAPAPTTDEKKDDAGK